MEKKYRGVVVPMVTPVTQREEIDTQAVEAIIDEFADSGVCPLLLGTTGEGNSVSPSAAQTLVETAVAAARGRVTVYAALTGNCVSEQIVQANRYFETGVDVVAATLPNYYALTPRQMEEYYLTLAEALNGPLMLYNILATTHMSIPIDVVTRLADHPNIVGLKDSENNIERLREILRFSKDRGDFSFFCGRAAFSAETLALGADGIVPSGGNFVPRMYRALYDRALEGDVAEAARLQRQTADICAIYQKGFTLGESLAALKLMLSVRHLCQPWMLKPLTRLTPDQEQEVLAQCSALTAVG